MISVLRLIICALIMIPSAAAQEVSADAPKPIITVEQPYGFATLPGMTNGAAFMVIKNESDIDDVLIAVESAHAEINEIHENMIDPDDGTMMMRKIKRIDVPANGHAVLEPTGKHLMLIKLQKPLTLGEEFSMVLVFEKAGRVDVVIPILPPGVKPDAMPNHRGIDDHLITAPPTVSDDPIADIKGFK